MNFRLRKGDVGVKNKEGEWGSVLQQIFWPLGLASPPACQRGRLPVPCFFMLITSLAGSDVAHCETNLNSLILVS